MQTATGRFGLRLVPELSSWQCSRPEPSAPPARPAPTSSALQTAISAKSASFVDEGDRGRHSWHEAQRVYKQNGYQLAGSDGPRTRSTIEAVIAAGPAQEQRGR